MTKRKLLTWLSSQQPSAFARVSTSHLVFVIEWWWKFAFWSMVQLAFLQASYTFESLSCILIFFIQKSAMVLHTVLLAISPKEWPLKPSLTIPMNRLLSGRSMTVKASSLFLLQPVLLIVACLIFISFSLENNSTYSNQ